MDGRKFGDPPEYDDGKGFIADELHDVLWRWEESYEGVGPAHDAILRHAAQQVPAHASHLKAAVENGDMDHAVYHALRLGILEGIAQGHPATYHARRREKAALAELAELTGKVHEMTGIVARQAPIVEKHEARAEHARRVGGESGGRPRKHDHDAVCAEWQLRAPLYKGSHTDLAGDIATNLGIEDADTVLKIVTRAGLREPKKSARNGTPDKPIGL